MPGSRPLVDTDAVVDHANDELIVSLDVDLDGRRVCVSSDVGEGFAQNRQCFWHQLLVDCLERPIEPNVGRDAEVLSLFLDDVDQAMSMIAGSARSMGLQVEG